MKCMRLWPAVLMCCAGVPAFACDYPPLVQVPAPDDAAGREAEVQQEVAEYMAAMQVYTDCIKAELAAAGGDAAPELQRAMLVRRNNLAVAEVEAVLKLVNAAVGPNQSAAPAAEPSEDESEGRRRDRD